MTIFGPSLTGSGGVFAWAEVPPLDLICPVVAAPAARRIDGDGSVNRDSIMAYAERIDWWTGGMAG